MEDKKITERNYYVAYTDITGYNVRKITLKEDEKANIETIREKLPKKNKKSKTIISWCLIEE